MIYEKKKTSNSKCKISLKEQNERYHNIKKKKSRFDIMQTNIIYNTEKMIKTVLNYYTIKLYEHSTRTNIIINIQRGNIF